MHADVVVERPVHLRRAMALTLLTLTWNVIEGVVAIAAAAMSGSVALLGFGVDSVVESTSASIMVWRLNAEKRTRSPEEIARLDHRARKLIAVSLFGLAAFIAWRATAALVAQDRPDSSLLGIGITTLSLVVMLWLASAKRRTAKALRSAAMTADSAQTTACVWLSALTLVGIGLNALFGWWWADPVAALGMTVFIAREGREAWRGEACC